MIVWSAPCHLKWLWKVKVKRALANQNKKCPSGQRYSTQRGPGAHARSYNLLSCIIHTSTAGCIETRNRRSLFYNIVIQHTHTWSYNAEQGGVHIGMIWSWYYDGQLNGRVRISLWHCAEAGTMHPARVYLTKRDAFRFAQHSLNKTPANAHYIEGTMYKTAAQPTSSRWIIVSPRHRVWLWAQSMHIRWKCIVASRDYLCCTCAAHTYHASQP